MSLHRSERYEEAIQAFQKAIEAGYREDAASYNIACGYALKGDRDKAFEWLRRAEEAGFDVASHLGHDDDLDGLRSDPRWRALKNEAHQHPSARQEREAAAAVKRYERIARKFEEYARAHPQKGRAWFNLGFASLAGERPDAAAEAFQKALELNYRKPTTMYNLACTYARLDQKDVAFDWLFKALDAGFDATGTLRGDEDLDNLRGDPRFRKALSIARAREKAGED